MVDAEAEESHGARQLRTLRELGACAEDATSAEEACSLAAAALAEATSDVPFAFFYLYGEDSNVARLVASVRAGETAGLLAPAEVDLSQGDAELAWPFAAIRRAGTHVFECVGASLAPARGEPGAAPRRAIGVSLESPRRRRQYGALICGFNPERALDGRYRGYFELAAAQAGNAIHAARARQEASERVAASASLARAKTAFLDQASHELRAALTLLLGPLEAALASPAAALAGEDLRVAQRSARRLLKLVGTLLDLSKLEAAGARGTFEPLELEVVTADLAGLFRSTVERAGLRLHVRCEPMATPVFVDRDMWETIVFNLLSNAFKSTFEGEIVVTLGLHGGRARLSVRDTGTGIPEEELPHLFERFHRVEGERTRTDAGSGIGLALMRELVRLHGGEVHVESRRGHGSLFTVEVPLGSRHLPSERIRSQARVAASVGQPEALAAELERWLPVASPAPHTELAGRADGADAEARILVADDDSDTREYVTRLLRRRWAVTAVADGHAALAAAREWQPQVVLADVLMPGLSGYGLLSQLRKEASTRSCSVVMLSARASEEARAEGLEAGANDYVVKPFSARELVARVAAQVRLAQLRQRADAEHARLFGLLMQLPIAMVVCEGANHLVTLKNPLADALTRGRLKLGESVTSEASAPLSDVWIERLDRVYAAGRAWKARALPVQREGAARAPQFYDVALEPLRDTRGAVTGILAVAHEVDAPASKAQLEQARLRELAGAAAREWARRLKANGSRPAPRAPEVEPSGGPPPEPRVLSPAVARPVSAPERESVNTARSAAAAEPSTAEPPVPPGPESSSAAPSSAAPPSARLAPKDLRVLVVDDDRDAALVLTEALAELGYAVEVAHDGPAALQTALSFRPHTALVDIGLPGMDGLELGRRLRAAAGAPGALRLVALTGYGRASDRRRSREAGFDQHLVKPVALEALSGAIAGARELAFVAAEGSRVTMNEHGG